jgi:hypothetical protein
VALLAVPGLTAEVAGASLDDLAGEWLDAAYVERLVASRSPAQAADGGVTAIVVKRHQEGYRWLEVYGFHESTEVALENLKPMDSRGFYELVPEREDAEVWSGKAHLEMPEPVTGETTVHEFTLHRPGQPPSAFIRAEPSMDAFVNRVVLAGHYVDILGRDVTFDPAGRASWLGGGFPYRIHLDTALGTCDSFTAGLDTEAQDFGFVWRGITLALYVLPEGNISGCEGYPSLILTKKG